MKHQSVINSVTHHIMDKMWSVTAESVNRILRDRACINIRDSVDYYLWYQLVWHIVNAARTE